MRIRSSLLLLLLACSLGGMVLVAVLTTEQTRLGHRRDQVGEHALMLRDLAQLEDGVSQFLLTTDLVIGSGESYLAPGAVRQADVLLGLLRAPGSESLRAVCPDDLAAIETGLDSIRDDVRESAESFGDPQSRSRRLEGLAVSTDAAAATVLESLASANLAATANAAAARTRLDERARLLVWITWLGAAGYAAFVAGLWWWASRRISGPLVALADAARTATSSGEPFNHPSRGPAEVRLLNSQLTRLIGNLEENVSERTEEIRCRNLQLAEAVREAEQASRAKGEFLARMSHEIRTPLNGVLGVADLLKNRPLEARSREYVDTIIHSAGALLRLINDLLDFSKVEAGKLELNPSDFLVEDLLQDMVRLLGARAQEKGLEFRVAANDACPEALHGDVFRIRQVLLNLLSNAIKFTPAGRVSLSLFAELSGNDDVDVRFEVADTGIGLSDEQLALVFDPFVQADGSTARSFGGTGLGLAISREIVEFMGGSISAESVPDAGSVFRLGLPLRVGSADRARREQAGGDEAAPIEGASDVRVLVAEDNEVNQMIAVTALEHLGFPIQVATDGRAALEIAREGNTDLILMDCQMPGMDGYEATRRIRAWEAENARAPVPIVALTANAFDEDRERCAEVGMDGFLSKPFTVDMLRRALLDHVADYRRRRKAPRSTATAAR